MHSFELIEKIIKEEKREKHGVEGMMIGAIIVPLIHFNNYECYLYGGADWVDALIIYLKEQDVIVKAIIDADETKRGTDAACGVKYISIDDLKRINSGDGKFVIITPVMLKGLELRDVIEELNKAGISNYYQLEAEDKNRIIGNSWTAFGSIRYYRRHIEELKKSYDCLEDNMSKEVMTEYIRARYEVGIYALENIDGRRKYWYGSESENIIYTHMEDEVWLNVGANIGDSILYILTMD